MTDALLKCFFALFIFVSTPPLVTKVCHLVLVCATKKKPVINSIGQKDLSAEFEDNGVMSQLLLEALDGFIMIITTDGQLFYVSESVKDFLGYSQATLIHQSLFKFLHADDHKSVKDNLVWIATDCNSEINEGAKTGYAENETDPIFKTSNCEKNFTCRIKCTLSHGGGFFKMFQCRGKMREIHIKKREVDNVQYGLFAVISPVNGLPSPSTMEMVRKEAMLGSQRRFELDRNLNIPMNFPSPYKTFMDSHHLRVPLTPNSEPVTPTNHDPSLRTSFFPPSFNYSVHGNCLRPGLKRRSSSSSGVNDDSSTTDENGSSEGSSDSTGPRRRVSFLLGDEECVADYGKREKISHRRMSAPTIPSTPVSSTAAYNASYGGMFSAGNTSWLFPPLTNPVLTSPELLHRMDSRPFMTSGLLSPMFPGYSLAAGGVYGPYSPNPFLKRAASFPNIYPFGDPSMLYPGMGDNAGQLSPSVRSHGYDPFSYFTTSQRSRRSSSVEVSSAAVNGSEEKVLENNENKDDLQNSTKDSQEPHTNDDEDVEINVTEESEPHTINLPIIKVQDYDSESNLCEKNNEKKIEQDDGNDERRPTKDEELKQNCSEDAGIQETLADIAQSFTSKLDSIRSSFTMSLDRNVASCLGKK